MNQLNETKPFFYIIQDVMTGKYYSGSRHAEGVTKATLLTSYFTSSKEVKALIEQGHKFIVRRIKEFSKPSLALDYEYKHQKRVNVNKNDNWINVYAVRGNDTSDPEWRKKTSESQKGRKSFWYGKTRSETTRKLMSEFQTGRLRSEATRKKISEILLSRSPVIKLKAQITQIEKNMDTTSGCYKQPSGKYRAQIKKNGTSLTLKYCDTPEEARAVARKAREEHLEELKLELESLQLKKAA